MKPQTVAKTGDPRRKRQFQIECPVTVTVHNPAESAEARDRTFEGRLYDVGTAGARFYLDRMLEVGTRLTLDAHMPGPNKRTTTVRFEGVVTEADEKPQHRIAVAFSQGGSFLRGDLRSILGPPNGEFPPGDGK